MTGTKLEVLFVEEKMKHLSALVRNTYLSPITSISVSIVEGEKNCHSFIDYRHNGYDNETVE